MSLLSSIEIEIKLKKVDNWIFRDNKITKIFSFSNYMDGVIFVNKIAIFSEKKKTSP